MRLPNTRNMEHIHPGDENHLVSSETKSYPQNGLPGSYDLSGRRIWYLSFGSDSKRMSACILGTMLLKVYIRVQGLYISQLLPTRFSTELQMLSRFPGPSSSQCKTC